MTTNELIDRIDRSKVMTLYIFAGQSNMVGRDDSKLDPVDGQEAAVPGVYMVDEKGQVVPAQYPFMRTGEQVDFTGPAYQFCKQAAARGEIPILLGAAVGGSALVETAGGRWYAPVGNGQGGDLYESMLSRAQTALSTPNLRIKLGGMFWAQGGADVISASVDAGTYVTQLDYMLSQLRLNLPETESGPADEMPFVVAGWPPSFFDDPTLDFAEFDAAIRDWAERTPNVAFEPGGNYQLINDNGAVPDVHINADGQARVGNRWVGALERARSGREGDAPGQGAVPRPFSEQRRYARRQQMIFEGRRIQECVKTFTGPGLYDPDAWATVLDAGGGFTEFNGQYWAGVSNQYQLNESFWFRFTAPAYARIDNLRYAAERAVNLAGGGDNGITTDANQWPTTDGSTTAVMRWFTGMAPEGVGFANILYLTTSGNRGLEKVYKPDTYVFEIATAGQDADPVTWNTDGTVTRTQDQTSGQPAIYEIAITEAQRSTLGIQMQLPPNTALTDLHVYRQSEAAFKDAGITLDPEFVKQRRRFNRWRNMELNHGNEWANLIVDLDTAPAEDWAVWDRYGPSLDFAIAVCNAADTDLQLMIPASAVYVPGTANVNTTFLTDWATRCRDGLKSELRVLPHFGNETWNLSGNNLFGSPYPTPAYVTQSIIAVDLGILTPAVAAATTGPEVGLAFVGRMQAHARATAEIWKVFDTVFASQRSRYVRIVETQIGNPVGATAPIVAETIPSEGITLGQMLLTDPEREIQVAGYFPNGVDTIPWQDFDPAGTVNERELFFVAKALPVLINAAQDSLASMQVTQDWVDINLPGTKVAEYEGGDQIGPPFPGIVNDWTTGTEVTFQGQAVYRPSSTPGESFDTIWLSNSNSATIGTFVPSEWTDTGAKKPDEYTEQERENAIIGMATIKSLALYRDVLVQFYEGKRQITGGACISQYASHGKPGFNGGFRALGIEWEEPSSFTNDYSYTGPEAMRDAVQKLSIRPNGQVPEGEFVNEDSGSFQIALEAADRVRQQTGLSTFDFDSGGSYVEESGFAGSRLASQFFSDPDIGTVLVDRAAGRDTGTFSVFKVASGGEDVYGAMNRLTADDLQRAEIKAVLAGPASSLFFLAADRGVDASTAAARFGRAAMTLGDTWWAVERRRADAGFDRYGISMTDVVPGVSDQVKTLIQGEALTILQTRGLTNGAGTAVTVGPTNGVSFTSLTPGLAAEPVGDYAGHTKFAQILPDGRLRLRNAQGELTDLQVNNDQNDIIFTPVV